VPSEAIRVTGDDAIELAYKCRSDLPGTAIGVNTRVSSYSMMDSESMGECRRVVNSFAKKHSALLLPVPISFYPQESDIDAAAAMIDEKSRVPSPSSTIVDPSAIIGMVRQCRIVLTGSYHSAVFALAQGIPAVGIVRSQYYRTKFLGLMDQFETECDVVSVDDDRFGEMLGDAAEKAWENSEKWRGGLLNAAERQMEAGRGLYDEMYRFVESPLAGSARRVGEYA
jgi:polysaccharide pyruvyl transferase WcaK-like protein